MSSVEFLYETDRNSVGGRLNQEIHMAGRSLLLVKGEFNEFLGLKTVSDVPLLTVIPFLSLGDQQRINLDNNPTN